MVNKDLNDAELTMVNLSESLRTQRKKLGLTMQRVADAAGLSVGFISQVERGITTPSLGSLASLAKVLQTDMSDFLNPPIDTETVDSKTRSIKYKDGADKTYERLSTKFAGSTLHSIIFNEPPGCRKEPISHYGEEMFFVIHGEITVELDDEQNVLHEGDSIHFNSQRVHTVWNHSSRHASIMWCGTTDIFAESISPIHRNISDVLAANSICSP